MAPPWLTIGYLRVFLEAGCGCVVGVSGERKTVAAGLLLDGVDGSDGGATVPLAAAMANLTSPLSSGGVISTSCCCACAAARESSVEGSGLSLSKDGC